MWIRMVIVGLMVSLPSARADRQPVFASGARDGVPTVRFDLSELRRLGAADGSFRMELPVPGREPLSLEVERFRVFGPGARVVLGTALGDMPAGFDPGRVLFLRGMVEGHPGSHVFLALGERSGMGRVELGTGARTYVLTSRIAGAALGDDELAIFEANGAAGLPLACGTMDGGFDPGDGLDGGVGPAGPPPVLGMKQGELAVDGDYELFTLFETPEDALEYMSQLYGAVSDITSRDARVRLDIVFMRIWTDPNDPYGNGTGYPQIPDDVVHDVSQLISGVRIGQGAIAEGICARRSLVGYSLGGFVDPTTPNVYNQDIVLCAHELGHTLGARHTHEMGIDRCDSAGTDTRRGPIMAYCYYFSGGYANTDLRYHTTNQELIVTCVDRFSRYADDCNQNGVDDAEDIAGGFSDDLNGNGVPDECEDCNGNGVIDEQDIAGGFSDDVNGNGVPDECEADCNGNGVPDEMDIRTGFSEDLYGNGVPDECEADCNGNGMSDYSEIQLDMTLDIDRDGVLDGCEDCDLDGTSDIEELDGANAVWAISSADGVIREYHPITGVLMRSGEGGHLADPQDVLITGDGRVLVSSAGADDWIVEFDRTGAFVRVLVASGGGGIDDPGSMLDLGDGTMLVSGRVSDNVVRFDIETGQSLGEFVQAGAGGLDMPYGLVMTATGRLLVGTGDHRVLEFDGVSGAFVRELVGAGSGGLIDPRDLVVLDGGRLVVASAGSGELLAYDLGDGAFLGEFHYGDFEHGLDGAWGLGIGGDGLVYSSASSQGDFHLTDPRMLTYDPENGYMHQAFVQRPDSELRGPRGFDFMPEDGDCNRNLIPDSCDIADGRSVDANGNGIPDECEDLCGADLDGDGDLDADDFFLYLDFFAAGDARADIDGDGDLDAEDFFGYLDLFASGC